MIHLSLKPPGQKRTALASTPKKKLDALARRAPDKLAEVQAGTKTPA